MKYYLSLKTFLVVLLLVNIAQAQSLTIEAESFADKGNTRINSAGYLSYYVNTYAATSFSVANSGAYTLTVRAMSVYAVGAWANMQLSIDNKFVKEIPVNSSTFKDFQIPINLTAGNHTIRIAYTNDIYGGSSGDRNLFVDRATLFYDGVASCPNASGSQFVVCHYDNIDFTALKTVSQATNINFNWGTGSPNSLISPDTFSSRIKGKMSFENSTYSFTATVDDGIRIFIDGQKVLDQWKYQASTTFKFDRNMTSGDHLIEIEYMENTGSANLSFAYAKSSSDAPPTPSPVPTSTTTPSNTSQILPAADALNLKTVFGAKGDGVTDDRNAFVAAANSGKNLYIPEGNYKLSQGVTFTNSTKVSIVAMGATLTAASGFNTGTPAMLHFRNPTEVTIAGFKIVGSGLLGSWVDGIRLDGGSSVLIANNTISNMPGSAVSVQNSDSTVTRGNTLYLGQYHGFWGNFATNQIISGNRVIGRGSRLVTGGIGILGTKGSTYTIENNFITEIGNTATKTEGPNNVIYRNNIVKGFATDGIKIMAYSWDGSIMSVSNGVIENNEVSGFTGANSQGSNSISLCSVIGGRVSGNKIYGPYGAGASLSGYERGIEVFKFGAGPIPRDIIIENNLVDSFKWGMQLQIENGTVRNNVVRHSIDYSVIFLPGAHDIKFTSNTFDQANLSVLFDINVYRITFESNIFTNYGGGIYAANSGNNENTFRWNSFGTGNNPLKISGTSNICLGNSGTNVPANCR